MFQKIFSFSNKFWSQNWYLRAWFILKMPFSTPILWERWMKNQARHSLKHCLPNVTLVFESFEYIFFEIKTQKMINTLKNKNWKLVEFWKLSITRYDVLLEIFFGLICGSHSELDPPLLQKYVSWWGYNFETNQKSDWHFGNH